MVRIPGYVGKTSFFQAVNTFNVLLTNVDLQCGCSATYCDK